MAYTYPLKKFFEIFYASSKLVGFSSAPLSPFFFFHLLTYICIYSVQVYNLRILVFVCAFTACLYKWWEAKVKLLLRLFEKWVDEIFLKLISRLLEEGKKYKLLEHVLLLNSLFQWIKNVWILSRCQNWWLKLFIVSYSGKWN